MNRNRRQSSSTGTGQQQNREKNTNQEGSNYNLQKECQIPPKEKQLSQCPGMTKHHAKLSVYFSCTTMAISRPAAPQKPINRLCKSPANTKYMTMTLRNKKTSESHLPGAPHPRPQARKLFQWTTTAEPKHPKPPQPTHTETPGRESKEYCCDPLHNDYSVCAFPQ